MSFLDMRTVLIGFVITNAICAFVIAWLWLHDRDRTPGIEFWFADFALQFVYVLLVSLRGIAPDLLSIVLANAMGVTGMALLYVGLKKYVGVVGRHWPNVVYIVAFTGVHAYFTYVKPSLDARNANLSLALAILCSQSAWLILRRADAKTRAQGRLAGLVMGLFSAVSLVRFVAILASPPREADLLHSQLPTALFIVTYQMLCITLTFALLLMVNRRLFSTLQQDVDDKRALAGKERANAAELRRLLGEGEQSRQTLLSVLEDQQSAEAKLKEQLDELRRWHEATLGREERILELKREINDLLAKSGLPKRYESAEHDGEGKS